jgi:hypothetical protein
MDSSPAPTGEAATEDDDDAELFSSNSSGLTKGALFFQRFQTAVHTALVTPPAAATWQPAVAALTAACAPPAADSNSQPSNYDEASDDGMHVVVAAQPDSTNIAKLAQSWQVLDGIFEFVLRGGAGGGVPRYDLLSDDELLSTALPHLRKMLAAVTAEISSSGSGSSSSTDAAERLQLCLGLCHKVLRLGARAWIGTTATTRSSSGDGAVTARSKWETLVAAGGQLAAAALATAAVAAAAKALALRLLPYLLPNTTTRAAEHGQLPPVTTVEGSVVAAVEDMVALHFPLRRGETLADVGQARAHATLKAALLSALSRSGALGLLRCCYSTLR